MKREAVLATASRSECSQGASVNVIYIDDDATNRAVLCDMMTLVGFSIHQASDATTGLRVIKDGAFDLVFMDLRMPGMSGLTAIRQLRLDPGSAANHHVVVVTADITPGVRSLCEAAGADEFLDKPVSMAKLFNVIGSVMIKKPGLQIE